MGGGIWLDKNIPEMRMIAGTTATAKREQRASAPSWRGAKPFTTETG